MLHWLRRGIDGWRLDAAYAVPSSFWATVLPAVRAESEQAWFDDSNTRTAPPPVSR
jgi:glycosidase